jgi:hypothetical protein
VGITAQDGSAALDDALAQAREHYPEVLIEQRAPGDDLRLVVIDGKVVAAALRVPAEVGHRHSGHLHRPARPGSGRRRLRVHRGQRAPGAGQPRAAAHRRRVRRLPVPGQPGLPQAWTPDETPR